MHILEGYACSGTCQLEHGTLHGCNQQRLIKLVPVQGYVIDMSNMFDLLATSAAIEVGHPVTRW